MPTLPLDTQDAKVFEFLQRRGTYQTEEQIAKALDCPIERVRDSLAQLEGFRLVCRHGNKLNQWVLDGILGDGLETVKKFEKLSKGEEGKIEINWTPFYEEGNKVYEEVYDESNGARYCMWDGANIEYVDSVNGGEVIRNIKGKETPITIVNYPINDAAISEGAVVLPTEAVDYGDLESLSKEIHEHIHRYVDMSKNFEMFSTWYILLSWVYDRINTLCYLRFLGDMSTGKSRALDVVGRLCYKPCLVSGSITPAPIYRMIRRWKGTIVLDEADFRKSDEKDEVVTILNCGFERGRPVIRCTKEDPDNIQILPTFGPKVLSTRGYFYDLALESRCLSETMSQTTRGDLPTILPRKFLDEEMVLRNKLLMFRFKMRDKINPDTVQDIDFGNVDPRLKQACASFTILFSHIPELMSEFKDFLTGYHRELIEMREQTYEGRVVNSIYNLRGDGDEHITPSAISKYMESEFDFEAKPQGVGLCLRKLGIETKVKRLGGKTIRCVKWDEEKMKNIFTRFVTAVTNVTAVTGTPTLVLKQKINNIHTSVNKTKDSAVPVTSETFVTAVTSDDQKSRLTYLFDQIRELQKKYQTSIFKSELLQEYETRKWTETMLDEDLNTLMKDGLIYDPNRSGRYMIV